MAKRKKLGKLNLDEMRSLINKKAGMNVAYDLTEDNPTEVNEWYWVSLARFNDLQREAFRYSSG